MKREIKFRGLRTDGKGWATGFYCNIENKEYYILEPCVLGLYWAEVIPESVGQFTGLKDKNGVDIYERDKLSDGFLIYIIEWNTQNTKFCLDPIKKINNIDIDIVDSLSYRQLGNGYYSRKDLEVIGNIHEQKE